MPLIFYALSSTVCTCTVYSIILCSAITKYRMKLCMMSRIIQTKVNVICIRQRWITLTKIWIIHYTSHYTAQYRAVLLVYNSQSIIRKLKLYNIIRYFCLISDYCIFKGEVLLVNWIQC